MMSDAPPESNEPPGLDELYAAVRSLYRWTWWTAGLLLFFCALWVCSGAVAFIRVMPDEIDIQREVDDLDGYVLVALGTLFVVTGFQAWCAINAAWELRIASTKKAMGLLLPAIVWLRRLLVVSTVWLALYLIILMLLPVIA